MYLTVNCTNHDITMVLFGLTFHPQKSNIILLISLKNPQKVVFYLYFHLSSSHGIKEQKLLSPCKQSKQGGSKFNRKKKSVYGCQRTFLFYSSSTQKQKAISRKVPQVGCTNYICQSFSNFLTKNVIFTLFVINFYLFKNLSILVISYQLLTFHETLLHNFNILLVSRRWLSNTICNTNFSSS